MAETLKIDGLTGSSTIIKTSSPELKNTTSAPSNTTNTKAGATTEAKVVAEAIELEYMTASFEFLPSTKIQARMLVDIRGCGTLVDGIYYLSQVTKSYSISGYSVTASGTRVGEATVKTQVPKAVRVEEVKLKSPKDPSNNPRIITIKIKNGDTLTKIARTYNTTVDYLVSLNGIKNRNLIVTGNSLKVPTKG